MPNRCPMKLHAFNNLDQTFNNVGKLFFIKIDLTKGEVLGPTNYDIIITSSQSY